MASVPQQLTDLAGRVPVERITSEARKVDPGLALLTLLAVVLYGLGWITARLCMVLWFGLAWSFTAVRLGWIEGRASMQAPASGSGSASAARPGAGGPIGGRRGAP